MQIWGDQLILVLFLTLSDWLDNLADELKHILSFSVPGRIQHR